MGRAIVLADAAMRVTILGICVYLVVRVRPNFPRFAMGEGFPYDFIVVPAALLGLWQIAALVYESRMLSAAHAPLGRGHDAVGIVGLFAIPRLVLIGWLGYSEGDPPVTFYVVGLAVAGVVISALVYWRTHRRAVP